MHEHRNQRVLPRAALTLALVAFAACRGGQPEERPRGPSAERARAAEVDRRPTRREVPVLEQVGVGCIPYAAAAVAQYHGRDVDPLQLLRALPVGPRGVGWDDVVAELRRRGIDAEMIDVDVAGIRDRLARDRPLVLGQSRGVAGDHALVAIRYHEDGDRYDVMDPASPALRTMIAAELEASWAAAGRRTLLVRP